MVGVEFGDGVSGQARILRVTRFYGWRSIALKCAANERRVIRQ